MEDNDNIKCVSVNDVPDENYLRSLEIENKILNEEIEKYKEISIGLNELNDRINSLNSDIYNNYYDKVTVNQLIENLSKIIGNANIDDRNKIFMIMTNLVQFKIK